MNRDILFVGGSLLAYVVGALLLLFVSGLIITVIDEVTGDAIGFFERIMGVPDKKE